MDKTAFIHGIIEKKRTKKDLRDALITIDAFIKKHPEKKVSREEIKRRINEEKKKNNELPKGNTYSAIISNTAKGKGGEYYENTNIVSLYNLLYFFLVEFGFEYNFDSKRVLNHKSLVYDGFYFRTKDNITGVIKLEIDNWIKGKLRFLYRSESWPYREFDLIFEPSSSSQDFKRGVFSDVEGISGTLVLSLPLDEAKRRFLKGIITYYNVDHKAINSSHLILQKDEGDSSIESSKFLTPFKDRRRSFINIPKTYDYFLNGRNLILRSEPFFEENKFSGYEESQKLGMLVGEYQSIHFPSSGERYSLKVYRVKIAQNGFATHDKVNGTDYGIAKIVNQRLYIYFSKSFKLGEASYESLYFDHMTYLLILDISNPKLLEGHYTGIINDNIASGPIVLELKENVKPISKKEIGLDEVKNILKKTTTSFYKISKHLRIRQQNQNHQILTEKSEVSSLPQSLYGEYSCYFSFRKGKKGQQDVSRFGQLLCKMPISINEQVVVKYGVKQNEYHGIVNVIGDDSKHIIQINFYESNFFSTMIFQVEEISENEYERIYGILTLQHQEVVESSSFICINNSLLGKNYKDELYERFQSLESIVIQDDITKGAATKILGPWNRSILMNEVVNEKLSIRKLGYRRVFWNSAVYNYLLAENSNTREKCIFHLNEVRYDFLRAFFHGFGMKTYAGVKLGDVRFPTELREETEMINEFYQRIKSNQWWINDDEIDLLHNKVVKNIEDRWNP